MAEPEDQLKQLAKLFEVELSYHDIKGGAHPASRQALLSLLPQLGAQLSAEPTARDLDQAVAQKRDALRKLVLEPVVALFDDQAALIPVKQISGRFEAHLMLEDGGDHRWAGQLEDLPSSDERALLELQHLPLGYHKLRLQLKNETFETLVIRAPATAYLPSKDRMWGVFAPTYALHDARSDDGGGLRELSALSKWIESLGGDMIGTLPLMATFLDAPFEPSPYAPVSRLFWNELFLDLPGLPKASKAKQINDAHVDYRARAERLSQVLSIEAEAAWSGPEQAKLQTFATGHPHARDYAQFRAACARQRSGFCTWPSPMSEGVLEPGDYDEAVCRYHLYAQLRMNEQLEALSSRAPLYLDLPLGVHPDGFDAYRMRHAFLESTSAGAPPDDLFAGGQDWGFRPLHPFGIREAGYDYVIACIRHQMKIASALRIDHVMGLHRLFCIPRGFDGTHGIYVRYRPDELYAILTLESTRHRCMLIGEDLGTVPDAVRAQMDQRGLLRMYVGQFSLNANAKPAMRAPPKEAVASMNTHDTPTFTAFWESTDIDLRLKLGHLAPEQIKEERAARAALTQGVQKWLKEQGDIEDGASTSRILEVLLTSIAKSDVRLMLINLEDLLGEQHAQNVPGTTDEHPNWCHKLAEPLESIFQDEALQALLRKINAARSAP